MNNHLLTVPDNISWDNYFLSLAFMASTRSKDQRTKAGCVIVLDDKSFYTGFNGCPILFNDALLCTDKKNLVVIHAEENALIRAGLERCRKQNNLQAFITFKPCPNCALKLVHYGVKRVIYSSDYHSSTNNDSDLELIRQRGGLNCNPAFTMEKYSGELLFSHAHMGVDKI